MKALKSTIAIIILLFFAAMFLGYRFSPQSAANAFPSLNSHASIIMKYDTSIGQVYIYEQDGYYVNIVPMRKAIFRVRDIAPKAITMTKIAP